MLDGVRVDRAGNWNEVEGVHARIIILENMNQKTLKACADMEARISRMENEGCIPQQSITQYFHGMWPEIHLKIESIEDACRKDETMLGAIDRSILEIQSKMECYQDKWSELHGRIESYEESRRKDKSQHEILHRKYETMLGTIDRSIVEINSKLTENMEAHISRMENERYTSQLKMLEDKLKNSGMECYHDKWSELHRKIESNEDARRKDKSQHEMLHTKYETMLGAIDRSILEINSKLSENMCRSALNEAGTGGKEWTSAVSDLIGEMTYVMSRLDEKASKTDVQSITRILEDLRGNYPEKLMTRWRQFDSESRSRTEEGWHKLDSELRGNTIEFQGILGEKASNKDLENMYVMLNQSCRDLTSSILAVRRQVVSLETKFREWESKFGVYVAVSPSRPRSSSPERCGRRHAETVADYETSRDGSLERVGGGYAKPKDRHRSSKNRIGLVRVVSSPCFSQYDSQEFERAMHKAMRD